MSATCMIRLRCWPGLPKRLAREKIQNFAIIFITIPEKKAQTDLKNEFMNWLQKNASSCRALAAGQSCGDNFTGSGFQVKTS